MLHDNIRYVITYQIGMIQQGEDAINLSFLQRQRTVMSQLHILASLIVSDYWSCWVINSYKQLVEPAWIMYLTSLMQLDPKLCC